MTAYDKIDRILAENGIEALIIADGCNMRYFTGFSGATGYVYVSKNQKIILTDSRYTTQAKEESEGFDVVDIGSGRNYPIKITELSIEDNVESIGFEDQVFLYGDYISFAEHLDNIKMIPLKQQLNSLRSVKTLEELKLIEQAEAIGDQAFTYILNILKPGISELFVAAELEAFMKKNGADGLGFDTIVASGPNSAKPHATPGNRLLETGDFVTMDFGCKYKGYCSDMTRTVVMGKANDKQKEIYNVVLEAQEAALAFVCAGKTGKQVDTVAREVITKAGYGDYFGHSLGHNVGLFIHESPGLAQSVEAVIEENMVETFEPGIYIPDFGGVRIEDLVRITKSGHDNYTHSKKIMIEL